jgi:hypothetical protein
MNRKHIFLLAAAIFISTELFAATSFSGLAGGKLNYGANPEEKDFDPDLKLQAFFAGQFNFSQNVWSHLEFSINTGDLLSQSIFHETESLFQIDEISLICRANLYNSANYISAFMGTYDPIGSDIFLQRYFNIKPIDSKLTESYLGLAGSILYPHFGIGIADVIKLYTVPVAFGGYIYVNHEDKDFYVINTDIRFASVLSYFTCDFACGLGIPLADKYKGEDVIIAVEKAYWHAGTTILVGNNFTNSLFMQAGIYNASFKAKESSIVSPDDLYILLEPRFLIANAHLNVTLYSLPKQTVSKLLLVEDTLGVNLNFFADASLASSNSLTYGAHLNVSLIDKHFQDLKEIKDFTSEDLNITITPYLESQFLSGQIHLQASIRLMDFVRERAGHAFSLDLGYRTKF